MLSVFDPVFMLLEIYPKESPKYKNKTIYTRLPIAKGKMHFTSGGNWWSPP